MNKIKVGYQRYVDKQDSKVAPMDIYEVFRRMEESPQLEKLTKAVRVATTKDERSQAKLKLPAIIVSAETTCRKVSPDDKRTGLIFIDLDLSDNPDTDLEKVVDSMDYPWLIGTFVSPSGGLKVLCAIEPSVDTHTRSFSALEKVFTEHGLNIDRSCKDRKRLTYICHDPDIERTLTTPLNEWKGKPILPAPEVKKKKYTPTPSSSENGLTPDDEVSLCLAHLSPDMDYQDWVNVGMIIKDHGANCSTWDDWSQSGESYQAGECATKWDTFEGSGLKIGTLIEMAKAANGGKNPITIERNSEPINLDTDFADDDKPAELEVYRFKNDYWIVDSTGERYIPMNDGALTRRLRKLGFPMKGGEGQMSPIDRIKDQATFKNTIDFCTVVAGRSIGLQTDDNDKRYLIPSKNTRVEAKQGDCSMITGIVENMLKEQSCYFYSWLHVSRKQLNGESYVQGHVLALAGQPNCGKSLCAEKIIRPLLGRSADPTKYLTGGTDFNADLVSAELLLMDDKGGGRSAKERYALGQSLKWISAGSHTVSCHPKGVDAYNLNPLWRCLVCMNDDDQSIGAFPPLGEGDSDSIGDKVLLLKCYNDIPLPFAGDHQQSLKLASSIKSEMQAFAYYVDNYQIPGEIKQGSLRLGFDEYHHPELLITLNMNSNERTLLSATDEIFFGSRGFAEVAILLDQTTQRYYWEGTANEWSVALRDSRGHGAYKTISSQLSYGDTSTAASKWLSKLKKIADGRILGGKDQKIMVGKRRGWRIWAPAEDEDGDGDEPF